MQLLSGEAAAQLCKQCSITASSSSLVDTGCCAVNTVLGAAYETVHQARGAFHPQDLCIQFSMEETFQCNPKERKHSHHPDHTHTYTPPKAERSLKKVTHSINSCCSQPAILRKTLPFSLLQSSTT